MSLLQSSINFKVRPLYETREENNSKETMSEIGQKERDSLFSGDCLEKKRLLESQHQEKLLRKSTLQ